MNARITFKLAWMSLALFFSPSIPAAQTNASNVLYSTGFEPSEGYDISLTLGGQQGWLWSGSGGNGLVTNTFSGRGQQAYVGFFSPQGDTNHLLVWHSIPATNQPALVRLTSSVLIFNSTNQNLDDFRWAFYNQQTNLLFSLTFDNENKLLWAQSDDRQFINTGKSFSNSVIYELEVTMNFASNYWSATLGGQTIITNLPLTSTNHSLTLGQVEIGWIPRRTGAAGNNYMVFDDLRVTSESLTPPPPSHILYATAFEPAEGFDRGFNLAGQEGWRRSGSGGNGLVTNAFEGRGQQAYIGYFPPEGGTNYLYLWHPINYQPPTNDLSAARLRFSTSMQIVNSTNQSFDDFRWSVYNTEVDRLFSINFNNESHRVTYLLDGPGDFVSTGVQFTNGVIYDLVINMDFASNTWNATLSGEVLATNQPITTTNALLSLGDVDAIWLIRNTNAPGNNYMVFDDYRVATETSGQPPPPASLRLDLISGLGGGPPYAVRVEAPPGTPYILDASTNLLQWTPFWTNEVPADGFSEYIEGPDIDWPYQFFRARQGP